jgi:glycosyltransferase involved in cell wall biosynthesis
MDVLVSLVVPCYNNYPFIKDSILSTLNQTYPHLEIIVIDDGSTDDSPDILRTFGDRIRWETQPNQGAPAARNRGLALAQGTYIKFLDADDILLPDAIERQVQQAQQLPGDRKAIVYGEALWIDERRNPIPGYPLRARQPEEDAITHILTACPLTSCPLHKRDYLLEVNGFDPTLPRGQEHDLHLRLALAGVEFIYYPDVVYEYRNYGSGDRISNHSLSHQGALVHYTILQKQLALVEAYQTQPLDPGICRAFAQRFWQFGRAILREGNTTAAQQYFQAAKALDPQHCIVGKAPYPQLVRWLGAQGAEAVFTTFKQLKLKRIGQTVWDKTLV